MTHQHIVKLQARLRKTNHAWIASLVILALSISHSSTSSAGYEQAFFWSGGAIWSNDPALFGSINKHMTIGYGVGNATFEGILSNDGTHATADFIIFGNSVQVTFTKYPCSAGISVDGTGCIDPDFKQPHDCSVGDPIIVANGDSFQTEVDYQSRNPFGLSFIRYYNSTAYDDTTNFDIKWRHNFARRVGIAGTNILVYRGNGQAFTFNYDGTNWIGDVDVSDTLVELVDGSSVRTGWSYTTANDDIEYYNVSGQLMSITNRQGQAKVLSYDVTSANGGDDDTTTLDKVTGFSNEVMTFAHDVAQRITSMTDPEGRVYLYSYDVAGALQSVIYPDETPSDNTDNPVRIYHYENAAYPYHLTGLTDETGSRVTWAFDTQGRAISSELDGGVDKSTLVFNADGSVTTTNPLNKDTTYHFTTLHGVKKVTQVEGHATASCVGANQNYTYDANGYMASKTDWQGKVTTYTHDARGLEVSRTEGSGSPEARTITTDWHATFRLPIKVTEPGQVTDYSYDAQGRLLSQTTHTAP